MQRSILTKQPYCGILSYFSLTGILGNQLFRKAPPTTEILKITKHIYDAVLITDCAHKGFRFSLALVPQASQKYNHAVHVMRDWKPYSWLTWL